jgi:hypothetical protein
MSTGTVRNCNSRYTPEISMHPKMNMKMQGMDTSFEAYLTMGFSLTVNLGCVIKHPGAVTNLPLNSRTGRGE